MNLRESLTSELLRNQLLYRFPRPIGLSPKKVKQVGLKM